MKVYFISLAVGALVGVLYGLIGVRSPAPPLIALAGLLGMVLGEQAVPMTKHMIAGHPPAIAWRMTGGAAKALGRLPGDTSVKSAEASDD